MAQATKSPISALTIDQAAPGSPICISALAEHHAELWRAPDDSRDEAELDAVEALMLGIEPRSVDESLSLAILLEIEMDTFVANLDSCHPGVPRLHQALRAIVRGLVRGGAKSPMIQNWMR
jgi:hypothetical protein